MANVNRHWVMAKRPIGHDYDSAFELRSEPVPTIQDGEILVQNHVLSMDSGTRMWMTDREDSYQPGLPLDAKLMGTNVGVVIGSNNQAYRAGDTVRCYGQWSDVSVVDPATVYCAKIETPLADLKQYVGILGANGWTAYVGVAETARVKTGDVFAVSAAAGCTGMMAGQIAKAYGARTIGIAGSDEKCALLQSAYGFDAAVNYKKPDFEAAFAATCPDGIDVYFDNVGGDILDLAMGNMALFGRIAVCGLMTNYSANGPVPGPYRFDQVLMKRLRIEGFFSPDFYHREPEFNPMLQAWMEDGALKLPFDVTTGLENTVSAYSKLFSGANIGKVVVEL